MKRLWLIPINLLILVAMVGILSGCVSAPEQPATKNDLAKLQMQIDSLQLQINAMKQDLSYTNQTVANNKVETQNQMRQWESRMRDIETNQQTQQDQLTNNVVYPYCQPPYNPTPVQPQIVYVPQPVYIPQYIYIPQPISQPNPNPYQDRHYQQYQDHDRRGNRR